MGREEDPNFELFFHFRWDRGWLSMKMLRLGKGSDFVVICAAFCHRKCMLFGEIHSVWCVPSTLTWRKNLKLSKNDFMHKIVYIIYIYISARTADLTRIHLPNQQQVGRILPSTVVSPSALPTKISTRMNLLTSKIFVPPEWCSLHPNQQVSMYEK